MSKVRNTGAAGVPTDAYFGDLRGREVHHRIRSRIQEALGERSWNWLAKTAGIPQSTLAHQAAKPKFSVEVLWRCSIALGVDIGYFFPRRGDPAQNAVGDAVRRTQKLAHDAARGIG